MPSLYSLQHLQEKSLTRVLHLTFLSSVTKKSVINIMETQVRWLLVSTKKCNHGDSIEGQHFFGHQNKIPHKKTTIVRSGCRNRPKIYHFCHLRGGGGQTALSPSSNSYFLKRILTVLASHFRFHLNSIGINESFVLDFYISRITISEWKESVN